MADSTAPVVSWLAVADSDLAGYRVYYGLWPGVYSGSQDVLAPSVSVSLPMVTFNNDGLWYFSVSAYDTTGNESARATPVSRRIVRTASQIKWRR